MSEEFSAERRSAAGMQVTGTGINRPNGDYESQFA
jgi:hypothetical protein